MRTIRLAGIAVALAAAAILVPAGPHHSGGVSQAAPADGPGLARYCDRTLTEAARADMESFRDFDAETFRALHDDRAVTVFPSGFVAVGIDAVMAALGPHFADRYAVWTWTETGRIVESCRSAVIFFDARYEIPSQGFAQDQIVAVTWIWKRGEWLAVADTNTLVP